MTLNSVVTQRVVGIKSYDRIEDRLACKLHSVFRQFLARELRRQHANVRTTFSYLGRRWG
jgi:hypothetical protein